MLSNENKNILEAFKKYHEKKYFTRDLEDFSKIERKTLKYLTEDFKNNNNKLLEQIRLYSESDIEDESELFSLELYLFWVDICRIHEIKSDIQIIMSLIGERSVNHKEIKKFDLRSKTLQLNLKELEFLISKVHENLVNLMRLMNVTGNISHLKMVYDIKQERDIAISVTERIEANKSSLFKDPNLDISYWENWDSNKDVYLATI